VRALLQNLRKESDGAAGDPLYVLLARCVIRSPLGCAALAAAGLPGPMLYWAPPDSLTTSFTIAGSGEAVLLGADGDRAATALQRAADLLFRRVIERRQAGCESAPRPRLYGGFRFDATLRDELGVASPLAGRAEPALEPDPWHSFRDASFVLPRWLLLHADSQSFLQLAIDASELANLSQIESELDAIERALSSDGGTVGSSPVVVQRDELSGERYGAMIEAALAEIAHGTFVKVVPARRSMLEADRAFDPHHILLLLDDSYPECNRFALERNGTVFLGATPELLIEKRGRIVRTEALAGTKPRGLPSDDELVKESLLGDDKERREHAHVVSAIVDSLRECRVNDLVVAATGLRSLRNVHHLCTPIQGALEADQHVLRLLAGLHPTPAVCGLPRDRAARFLAEHEPVHRGLYAAPVGWFDAAGDGEFWVAIRSALICQHRAWLYAGAGVVAGSVPHKEYHETSAKLRAMLSVLGVVS
jgi:isochorismate synthase